MAIINGNDIIEFEPITDTTKNIIKVVGVGGGGCNAVGNMYREGMESVTFAVCNTDSKSLSINPVPTKIMLGKEGLGAGANPDKGREEAFSSLMDVYQLNYYVISSHTVRHIEGTSKVWFERKKTITLPRKLVSFPK